MQKTNDQIWKKEGLGEIPGFPRMMRADYLPQYTNRAGKIISFEKYAPVKIPFVKYQRKGMFGMKEAYAHKDMENGDEVPHTYPNPAFVGDDCQYLTKYLKDNARAQCINQVRNLNFIKNRKEYKKWFNQQNKVTKKEMIKSAENKVNEIKGVMRGIIRGGKKRKTRKRRKSRKKHTKKYGKRRGNKSQRRRRKRKTRKH